MAIVLLPRGVYVFSTELCREAVLSEDGNISPGREIPKGAVLQALEDFPRPRRADNPDLVRYRVVRSPSVIKGADTVYNKSRVAREDEILLFMKEVFSLLKTDSSFQEEVEVYKESSGIKIASNMDQALYLFVKGDKPDL